VDTALKNLMNIKKHYLIRVWGLPNKDIHKGTSKHDQDGFHLAQEKIIKCYEKNITNLRPAKGFRATYEEVEAPKENKTKTSTNKTETTKTT
jgi:hypothetical protein